MSVDDAFNYKKVSETISTAGLLSEHQISALKQEGYQSVINLLPNESEYALQGEKELIVKQGLFYKYIPVDFSAPNEGNYRDFESAMKSLHGKKTMIHCAANYRVSAFYAIYARKNLGWSDKEAREHIASLWNPAEHNPWEDFIHRMLEGSTP